MTHGRLDLVGKSEIAGAQDRAAEVDEEFARVVHLHIQGHPRLSECTVKTENLYVILPRGSVLVVLSVLHGPVRQGKAMQALQLDPGRVLPGM